MDRDHRLIGKALHDAQFFVGERLCRTRNAHDADPLALPDHRREGDRMVPSDLRHLAQHRRGIRVILNVGIVDHAAGPDRLACRGDLPGGRKGLEHLLAVIAQIGRNLKHPVFVHQKHIKFFAAEKMLAAFKDFLEHRLCIGDRLADHPENFRGCPLLLKRFGDFGGTLLHFGKQTGVTNCNDGL